MTNSEGDIYKIAKFAADVTDRETKIYDHMRIVEKARARAGNAKRVAQAERSSRRP